MASLSNGCPLQTFPVVEDDEDNKLGDMCKASTVVMEGISIRQVDEIVHEEGKSEGNGQDWDRITKSQADI